MASISFLRLSPLISPKTLAKPYAPCSSFTPPLPLPLKSPSNVRFSHKSATTRMSYNPTPATDRLISAVAYTLPFFNSLQYGRFLFTQYPALGVLFDPIIPLLSLYRSIPYASFVAFFALYLGVVRNPSFNQYVRFNSMQAVTLDVLLVVPLLLTRIFSPGPRGLGFKLMVWGHNAVFLFSCFCFVYALVSSILGKTPYLPFVGEAAGRQI
ncbi:protein TIC 20-II, chloroplastic [Euphorbia lathyris]|uniref:protein TIC 20-II, chloroplastic n=1 Tax=Euphorbia lathyris TaxID=212925 RepID=UPI003313E5CB